MERFAFYERAKNAYAVIATSESAVYSERLLKVGGFATPRDMYTAIYNAYKQAAKAICADGIIPCGKAMLIASETGMEKVHRDTFHASFGAGRYLLALCWYKKIFGKDISNDTIKVV